MAWDDPKGAGNELTSAEWNNHVTDQKSRAPNSATYVTTDDESVDLAASHHHVNPVIDDTTNDLKLFVGGHWVGTTDPATVYPNTVQEGHRWTNPEG